MKMKKMKMKKMMKLEKRKSSVMMKKISKKKISVFIPEDVVTEILLRLPAKSLGKYRCVSKSWLSITSNAAFIRTNAQLNQRNHYSSVILEDLTGPTNKYSDFDIGLVEYQQPTKSIPKHSFAIASCDGLVCVARYTCTEPIYHVINPLTGQFIALPVNDKNHIAFNMGFYFHRSTSTYRLIRCKEINYYGDVNEVLVLGEKSWRSIPGNPPAFAYCNYPLDLNGNIYWLAFSQIAYRFQDMIVIFDEEKEVYTVISLPSALPKALDFGRMLFDFNGELGLSVVGKNNTIDVWIMEENLWIMRHSVNYENIHRCPSQLICRWSLRGAVIIGDEELLFRLTSLCACRPSPCPMPSPRCEQMSHHLVGCNLKSGACVVQKITDHPGLYYSIFSFTESLTNIPECSNIHITH